MTLGVVIVVNEPPPVALHAEKLAPEGALALPAVSFQKLGLAFGSKFEPAVTVCVRMVPGVPLAAVVQVEFVKP